MGYIENYKEKSSVRTWTLLISFVLCLVPGINVIAFFAFLFAAFFSIYYAIQPTKIAYTTDYNDYEVNTTQNIYGQNNNSTNSESVEKINIINDFFNSNNPKVDYNYLYDKKDFTVLDFETANEKLYSACSLGLVIIRNGEIVDKKYFLIRPKELRVRDINYKIHKISEDDLRNAPEFNNILADIESYISNSILVCHNASTDINVLKQTLNLYNMSIPDFRYIDTLKLFPSVFPNLKDNKLATFAQNLGFQYNAHNALADAEICAKIFQKCNVYLFSLYVDFDSQDLLGYSSQTSSKPNKKKKGSNYRPSMEDKKIDKTLLENIVINDYDSPFYNKRVIFTGDLFVMQRQEAAEIVISKGGIILEAISGKVNIVIQGVDAGWKKLEQIQELQNKGKDIQVIDEETFLQWIDYNP